LLPRQGDTGEPGCVIGQEVRVVCVTGDGAPGPVCRPEAKGAGQDRVL